MALVPGLRGGLQERPDLERNTGRVGLQTDGVPKNHKLRPQATPIETYTRPPALPKDNDADRLIASLAGLNPALLQLGAALKDEQKDKHAGWNAKIATMKAEDIRRETRDNPNGDLARYLHEEKGQELFAAKLAQDTVTRAQEEWAAGPKEGADVESFIAGRINSVVQEHGGQGRERFTNEFLRLSKPGFDSIRSGQLKHNVETRTAAEQQGAFALIERTIANGVTEGKKPDDIATAVRSEIKGNKDLARLDPTRQETEVLNIATRYAEQGNVELVRALVNSKGANGFSLLENREHSLKATKLLEHANSKLHEKNKEGFYETASKLAADADQGNLNHDELDRLVKERPGLMPESTALSLKRKDVHVREQTMLRQQKQLREDQFRQGAAQSEAQNKFARNRAVTSGALSLLGQTNQLNVDGTSQTVSAEDNRKSAISEFFEDSGKVALRDGETPEQTFDRELAVMRQNGFASPAMRDAMQRGIQSISAVTAPGDKVPESFAEGYRLYTQMKAKAPGLLNAHLSNDEQEKWGLVHTLVEKVGMDPNRAAAHFNLLQKEPEKLNDLLKGPSRHDLSEAVRREFGANTNVGAIERNVQARAAVLTAAGVNPKSAIKSAIEEFKGKNVKINGWYVDATDRELPPDFGEMVDGMIANYAVKHGRREAIDASDITIVPASSGHGVWRLVDKNTGRPLMNPEDSTFTSSTLARLKADREEAKMKAIMAKQQEYQQRVSGTPDPGKDTRQLPVSRIGETIDEIVQAREEGLKNAPERARQMAKEPSVMGEIVQSIFSGNATEAQVPEALPPGGRYRDIVRGN